MPWQRAAGLGLAAILLAIWPLYVRRRALAARREGERRRDAQPQAKRMAA